MTNILPHSDATNAIEAIQRFDCSAQPAGLSVAERRRFTVEDDSTGPPVLDLATTDSNTWLEVNYTQLVATGRRLLPRVKPGTIAMAMVKVGPLLPLPPKHADCCGLAAWELCIETVYVHSSQTGKSCVEQAGHP